MKKMIAFIVFIIIIVISYCNAGPSKPTFEPYFYDGICNYVLDGDTINVMDQDKRSHRIRLADIDAPETDQPYGTVSTHVMRKLVQYHRIHIEVVDKDKYGREVAFVTRKEPFKGSTDSGNTTSIAANNPASSKPEASLDVNAYMLLRGHAWHYLAFAHRPIYHEFAEQAKFQRLGLWHDDCPIAPWVWRADNLGLSKRAA